MKRIHGIKYFDEAIRIGTFEYQNADFDDDNRGDFVKQVRTMKPNELLGII